MTLFSRSTTSLLLLGAGLALGGGCGSALTHTLHASRYREIVPPSTLVPPGTIVKIVSRSPLVLERVCSQRAALGEVQPDDSTSANQAIVRKLNASVRLGGDYLQQLRLSTRIAAIRNVQLDLTNVHVVELSRDVVREHLPGRSEACRKEIADALAAKEKLAMIQSVIQADVQYAVDFERGFTLDAGASGALLRGLGVDANATLSHGGSTKVSGTSLFWGIRVLSNAKSGGIDGPTILRMFTTKLAKGPVRCRDPEDAAHRQALLE